MDYYIFASPIEPNFYFRDEFEKFLHTTQEPFKHAFITNDFEYGCQTFADMIKNKLKKQYNVYYPPTLFYDKISLNIHGDIPNDSDMVYLVIKEKKDCQDLYHFCWDSKDIEFETILSKPEDFFQRFDIPIKGDNDTLDGHFALDYDIHQNCGFIFYSIWERYLVIPIRYKHN